MFKENNIQEWTAFRSVMIKPIMQNAIYIKK